ncbi:hypothetical protein M0R45_016673 [Rubus argutus]|uniref:Uncharacterized protein n=1 Tax=Rubus argutus TaxID=59490 RepID=A0AAW1XTA2_RUBAR
MKTYNSKRALECVQNFEFDHEVESNEDVDFKEELWGVGLDTPHKKLVRRPQKPKKKAQSVKGLKDQLGLIASALSDIQAQTTLINQKPESLAISIECLTQRMEDVNQELLTQRKRTRHIEDYLHKDKGPKKVRSEQMLSTNKRLNQKMMSRMMANDILTTGKDVECQRSRSAIP